MRVTVIGGHGRTGLQLVQQLIAAKHDVVATIRNPEHEAALTKRGAEAKVVDLEISPAEAIVAAFQGSDADFCGRIVRRSDQRIRSPGHAAHFAGGGKSRRQTVSVHLLDRRQHRPIDALDERGDERLLQAEARRRRISSSPSWIGPLSNGPS